ncbi:MAG TPA: lysophospholipid acyltransferase family protein [Anaerolineales bacterium]|nr:lysophospholipid acyltransferase family protein [Anaerolineales bacterium]
MLNFLRWLLRRFVNLIADVKVTGLENIPSSGAFVIATNHIGLLDAAMLYYILDRTDVFVPIAEKWEKNGLFRWLAKYANFVFIDRYNPDIKALRRIIGLMEKGNILVIAPEGTRSLTAALAEGKLGAGYLAAKLNRPILPAGIAGTEDRAVGENLRHFRRSHIVIRAGKLFSLPPLPVQDRSEALKKFTDEIMCHIAAELPEKYRGVYSEHPRLKALLSGAALQ